MQAIDMVNELNPDFVLTGGDLIADALETPYEKVDSLYNLYTEMSKKFNMPVYNTIGNHEHFGIYRKQDVDTNHPEYNNRMFEHRIGKRYYSFDYKGWHFIVLDAVSITKDRDYIGLIEDDQIEWIKSDLQKVDKKTPIAISVHIPFITAQTQLVEGSLASNPAYNSIFQKEFKIGRQFKTSEEIPLLGIFRSEFTKLDVAMDHLLVGQVSSLWRLKAMKGNEARPDVSGKPHQVQVGPP